MLERIKSIPKTNLLDGKRIIVTGCGFKPAQHSFYDVTTKEESHDSVIVDGKDMKLNIGAATAFVLASNGAIVHMVSRTEDNLKP